MKTIRFKIKNNKILVNNMENPTILLSGNTNYKVVTKETVYLKSGRFLHTFRNNEILKTVDFQRSKYIYETGGIKGDEIKIVKYLMDDNKYLS